MSKQTKRPAKAGNSKTFAQLREASAKASTELKKRVEEAKENARKGTRFLKALEGNLQKVDQEFLSQGTAPYGKDFFVNRAGKLIRPTGKHWESKEVYTQTVHKGQVKLILDPTASSLKEDWLFVVPKPKVWLLPHLYTVCTGKAYVAPKQPKTFKVVERKRVNLRVAGKYTHCVNRAHTRTLKYRLGDVWDAVEAFNG